MEQIEIITRLRKLGKRFPTKYLSGVFKKEPNYITYAINGTAYPELREKIINHISLLEAKNETH